MKLYENIKNRRIELNLSQTELAKRVGYKDKASISRVENGKLDLTQSMIEEFANALECSPSYLMGWSDNLNDEQIIKEVKNNLISSINRIQEELDDLKTQDFLITLSDDEKILIEQYRKANTDAKKRILKYSKMEISE